MAGSVEEHVAKAVSLSAKTIVLRCTVAYNHSDLEDRIHSPCISMFFSLHVCYREKSAFLLLLKVAQNSVFIDILSEKSVRINFYIYIVIPCDQSTMRACESCVWP